MASLNKVIIIGTLTRMPEVRYTPNGKAVADIGIAINSTYGTGDQRKEETTFVDVTVWGKSAENAGQYLSKGSSVCVEGRLQTDSWEDKQSGQKRTRLKVVADSLQFLDRKQDSGGAPRQSQQQQRPRQRQQQADPPPQQDEWDSDQDIPY